MTSFLAVNYTSPMVLGIYASELGADDRAYLAAGLQGHNLTAVEGPLEGTPPDVEVLSVMVHSTVDRAAIDAMPRLRLIATRSTGYDHIDLEAACERGITVCNVPAYGSNTVAEHTFALILSLSRKTHKAHLRCLQGDVTLDGLMGFDLAGKTLGIVGVGRIGLHVARIGKGFGMTVLAHDPFVVPMMAELIGFDVLPLDDMLPRCDVLAICCPLDESTRHMIDRESLARLRPGALLVNTARGGVVDTTALLWALDAGIVAGAGLDVLEGEELLGEDQLVASLAAGAGAAETVLIAENLALMRHPNVIVTPHMAFYSAEALRRILDTTIENILAFAAGMPQNVVS